MTGERGIGWGLEERKRGRGSEKFLSLQAATARARS
tara:strand:- start:1666 stop:1773 length:108 start_codon:yes stop_codon:yes gene_type:complete